MVAQRPARAVSLALGTAILLVLISVGRGAIALGAERFLERAPGSGVALHDAGPSTPSMLPPAGELVECLESHLLACSSGLTGKSVNLKVGRSGSVPSKLVSIHPGGVRARQRGLEIDVAWETLGDEGVYLLCRAFVDEAPPEVHAGCLLLGIRLGRTHDGFASQLAGLWKKDAVAARRVAAAAAQATEDVSARPAAAARKAAAEPRPQHTPRRTVLRQSFPNDIPPVPSGHPRVYVRPPDLTREMQFVPYQYLYSIRPDVLTLRSGDTFDCPGKHGGKQSYLMLTASYFNGPYLLTPLETDIIGASTGGCRRRSRTRSGIDCGTGQRPQRRLDAPIAVRHDGGRVMKRRALPDRRAPT